MPITDEEYEQCNKKNRELVDDFLINSTQLSDKTLLAYKSNLRIWLKWIKDNLNNKNITEIKPREYLRFQNWLIGRGCSSSDVRTKRSTISSLNNYIEVYYLDEYPTFRNCVNSSIPIPEKHYIHEKNPPTREEIEDMCNKLEQSDNKNKYQLIAYLKFTFETGCRRAETIQIMKDIVNAEKIAKQVEVKDKDGNKQVKTSSFYQTPPIRCKGRGKTGKIRKLKFSDYSMDWIKKWVEVRGEDNVPNLFVTKYGGNVKPANTYTINEWCSTTLTKLLGRNLHPHSLRSSAATDIVMVQGKDINVARSLLGHESSEVTLNHYVIGYDMDADADELFIDE